MHHSGGRISNSNNLLFLDVAWFNTVGIVLCQDRLTREYKSYIGPVAAGNEHTDIEDIMAVGSPFPLDAARVLFPGIDLNEDFIENHPELFI